MRAFSWLALGWGSRVQSSQLNNPCQNVRADKRRQSAGPATNTSGSVRDDDFGKHRGTRVPASRPAIRLAAPIVSAVPTSSNGTAGAASRADAPNINSDKRLFTHHASAKGVKWFVTPKCRRRLATSSPWRACRTLGLHAGGSFWIRRWLLRCLEPRNFVVLHPATKIGCHRMLALQKSTSTKLRHVCHAPHSRCCLDTGWVPAHYPDVSLGCNTRSFSAFQRTSWRTLGLVPSLPGAWRAT